jgi:uncharacterized protein DUF4430
MKGLLRLHSIDRVTVLLAAALLVLAPYWGLRPAAGESPNETVRLVVDYGDGISKTIDNLAWAKGNTVLDVMKAGASRPHGISFSFTGTGAATVLTRIDDVQNEGGGAGRKNWQYWINDAYGDKSFAVYELQAHDVVVWRYATEQGTTEQGK